MQDKFDQFSKQTNGKFIEVEDAGAYAQCMDLAFSWCDVLGIPREAIRHQYAYQVWNLATDLTRKYFDLIPNSATNVPVVGDMPVFGTTVGPAGHISIETGKSNSINLMTLDQNWGTPKYTREVTHANYSGVIGWLHPKGQTPVTNYDAVLNQIRDIINSGGDSHVRFTKIKELVDKTP